MIASHSTSYMDVMLQVYSVIKIRIYINQEYKKAKKKFIL